VDVPWRLNLQGEMTFLLLHQYVSAGTCVI
jgi:hypothetical protein